MVLTQRDLEDTLATKLAEQTLTIKVQIEESVSAIRKEIIAILNEENQKLRERLTVLESRNDNLESKIESLETKLETNFQYQRDSNVTLSGIPQEVTHDQIEGIVVNLFNKVCLHAISHRDIIACHRLSTKNDTVVVKFINRKDATALLNSKLAIKEVDKAFIAPNCKMLYVNEHLTPYMSQLAYKCRCLKRENKIYQTKVEKGIVKVLTNKDGSFRWFSIRNDNDINFINEANGLNPNNIVHGNPVELI